MVVRLGDSVGAALVAALYLAKDHLNRNSATKDLHIDAKLQSRTEAPIELLRAKAQAFAKI